MSNEQSRGTPILSLEVLGGVESTSMLKPEGGSDGNLSSNSESKDLRLSGDASQSTDHHSLDGHQAVSVSVPDTTIIRQHDVDSPDAAAAPSPVHSALSEPLAGHTDSFAFASVSGHDAVQLNDSFASQDVVHSQFGASASDFSVAPTSSALLWSDHPLSAHLDARQTVQGADVHHTSQPQGSGGGDPDGQHGQLWAADDGDTSGNPDGHSDARIEHMDSDGLASDQVDSYSITSTGAFISVGLDTAANLYFAEDNNDQFYVGHISTGANISETTIASTSDEDVTNSFVVDPANTTIYMDLDGGDYTADGGDIIKITYNQFSGSISSPYNPSSFAINLNDVLVDSTSSGGIYQDGRAFALSSDGSTLYYVDDDDGNPADAFTADTNGIYKISTTGDVGQGTAPTPVLLSSQSQFPTNDSDGYITGIAVNQAQGLIYFTTDGSGEGVNTSQDAIWYMPITGGTATKMTLPGGVSLEYASFFSENMAFDPDARTLYVADQEQDHIIQLVLNGAGTGFASGNDNFYTTDTNGSDGASTYALTWGDLATEGSLTGTTTQVVQGGSAVTLLTATPTITNPEGTYIPNLEGYTIRVIGGTAGNGSSFGITSGSLSSAAGVGGDELYINGSQTASLDGGQVNVSWNNSTQTLTLTGDVSESEYKTLLSEVTFQENANTDTTQGSHPTRVIDFIANDGIAVLNPTTSDPNEQTITITLNRAPTVVTENFTAVESNSASGSAGTGGTGGLDGDSDLDGDSLTISAVNGNVALVGTTVAGTYGHLTMNANGSYTYNADNTSAINSAATGSHPVDTFNYTVSDGHGGNTTQTINITIDRPPSVVTENVSLVESGSASGTSGTAGTGGLDGDSDADGDSLSILSITGGTLGTALAGTYGSLTLSSNGTYTYNATNTSAINGAATGSHPVDTFTYTVSDGHGGTTLQTINFSIDRAPSVVTESAAAVESASASGTSGTGGTGALGGDSDPDGDSLTITAITGGTLGTALSGTYGQLTLNANGSYSYAANNTAAINSAATGSHPVDSFTYTVSDGHGGTQLQTLNITIDRAPTVVTEGTAVVESATATGTAGTAGTGGLDGDSDKDGDSLTITAISGGVVGSSVAGTYGNLTLNADGSYSYTADNTAAINAAATGSHPVDSFSYTVSDGHGGTTIQTINITIDRPPVGNNDAVTVFAGGTSTASTYGTGALSVDSDPDGDTLTVTAISGGTVGTSLAGTYGHLTLNADGTYSYTADNSAAISGQPDNAVLTDTFTYTLSDQHGATTTAELVFTVDQAPTVTSLTASATSSANFSAAHTVTFTLDVGKNVNVAGGTTLSLSDGGTATYVSGSGTQTLVFTYSATDAPGSLTVTGVTSGSLADAAGNALAIGGTAVSVYTDAVTDSAANVAANFASLDSAVSYISSITLNDGGTPNLDLTASDILNDQTLIGKIVSSYNLVLNDTAATIGTDFDSLETYAASISSVVFTDGGTPTLGLTQTQASNDATLLGKVQGPYDLLVSGVTGQAYVSYQNDYNAANTLTEKIDFFTNGSETFYGYVAGLTIAGNNHNDTYFLESAPAVTATGGTGNDLFFFGSGFTSADAINGGGGTNTLELDGTYTGGNALSISTGMMSNIQTLLLAANHSYNITLDAGVVTTGHTLTVSASGLGSGDALTVDGSALTAGTLVIDAGAGVDNLTGGAGKNFFYLGANLTAADEINGGAGTTTVNLNGDYSGGLTFTSTTMVNVDTLSLSAGHSYDLVLNAATIGSGQTMTILGNMLGSSDNMTIDGSALTTGTLVVDGGAGTDIFTGGAGTNTFVMDGNFSAADQINGGTGTSAVHLDGDYSAGVTFTATTMTNISSLNLGSGFSYDLTMNAATVANGQTLAVQGGALGVGDSLTFNGAAVTDGGTFNIFGGAGSNTLTGGAGADTIHAGSGTSFITGGGGADLLLAGSGTDTFAYNAVSDSTSTTHDTINGFNTSGDLIDLLNGVTAPTVINTAVTTGNLSNANFDRALAHDIGAAQLSAHGAVLFTASTGAYAGDTFLIIDENGVAGYQASQDLVIEMTHGVNLSSLSLSNFESVG
jgi:VCBS repeat-containing protein